MVADKLRLIGVISFITLPKNDHAICFVYFSDDNSEDIEAKEKNKVIPEWVEVNGFEDNASIPSYYRAFLKEAFKNKGFINCKVEWDEHMNNSVTFI